MGKVSKGFSIPVELCSFVLNKKYFNQFRTLLFLKYWFGGQFNGYRGIKKGIASKIGISERTLRTHLADLQERNWVGYNPKKNIYHLRGFKKLCQLEGVNDKIGAYLEYKDFEQIRAFVLAVCLGKLVRHQRKEAWKKSREQQSWSSKHRDKIPTSFPLSCEAIQKIYDVSISTASDWKKEAKMAGFLKIESKFKFLEITPEEANNIRKYNPELGKKLIIRDKKVFEWLPDIVEVPNFFGARHKKRKPNIPCLKP